MADEELREKTWKEIVNDCASRISMQVNCGSEKRRLAILWADKQIKEAGYRKVEGKPPVITRLQIREDTHYIYSDKVWEMIEALLTKQRDADVKHYEGG